MLDLAPQHLDLVRRLVARHVPGLEVRAFGSRVTGRARPTSDLDLALMSTEPLDLLVLADLREAFSESDLPMRVDVVDWSAISPAFRRIIEARYEVV
jgi:predicted nucleotidyltransferase